MIVVLMGIGRDRICPLVNVSVGVLSSGSCLGGNCLVGIVRLAVVWVAVVQLPWQAQSEIFI